MSKKLEKLTEELGTKIGEDEKYLMGKPREYYCEKCGPVVLAVVHDPYDAPEYICKDCYTRLSYRKLDKNS